MLSVLLHLHQPDYREPGSHGRGEPVMPWVRLHATRGYRDVLRLVASTGAPLTINLVGSLVDQLEHYAHGGGDGWLRVAERPADALEPGEQRWMLDHFFAANPRVFRWFPAWGELRNRATAGERFTVAQLRDLQVWAQLGWFGWTALEDWPELAHLRKRGQGYTEDEKRHVLAIQRQILRELPALLRGLAEVWASPMYHPILPLLVDTAHAARAHPGLPDPGFRAPEDALLQLRLGRARVAEACGREVHGLWPSEGAVSPEALELAEAAGFRWFASDEAVLTRSSPPGLVPPGPFRVGGLRGVFRDRELSDRIGFRYADVDGPAAAHELVGSAGDGPVLLALDGENPWEAYQDAGKGFLETLVAVARLRSVGELAEDKPRGRLSRVHTGSWVFGELGIWIGHEEDRVAWRLLARCRRDWVDAGKPAAALDALLAAEGSDWFWWYGEDFDSPEGPTFDALFRGHLLAAWHAMGVAPPAEAHRPLKRFDSGARPPRGPLGEGDDWFTWAQAGRVSIRGGAMATKAQLPRALLYGATGEAWGFRLLGGGAGWVIRRGEDHAAFRDGRAELPPGPLRVWLEGPGGVRIPEAGEWELPG